MLQVKYRIQPIIPILCVLLLLGSACQPIVQPLPAPSASTKAVYTPLYEPAGCQYAIPEGEKVECGYLVVPEDRNQADGSTIRLHVVNFKSQSATPALDPLFIVHGGPAAAGDIIIGIWTGGPGSTLRADRDNIYLEYRGTNFSEPAFYCPEMEAELAQFAGMTLTEEIAWSADAIRACGERLTQEGRNLSAYSPLAAAADLADLRIALGYDEINLYGISYGTLISMLMMAHYPQGIRSIALDSIEPPEVDWVSKQLEAAYNSFNTLFAACATDPACDAAYPGLEEIFYAVLATLRQNPITVTIEDESGSSQAVLVDDLKFVHFIRDTIFFADAYTFVPAAIYAAHEGDYQAVAQQWLGWVSGRHGAVGPGTGSDTLGVYYSMMCLHNGSFGGIEQAQASYDEIGGDTSMVDWAVATFLNDILAACEHWNVTTPEPNVEIQTVDSDLPVLMLVGSFDPDLPPFLSQQYANRFANGYDYELPYGHVLLVSPCGLEIIEQFLANPEQAPDASCLAEMTSGWLLPE
jgi:pimeloyl-ACP methyl ester carboxylesterase